MAEAPAQGLTLPGLRFSARKILVAVTAALTLSACGNDGGGVGFLGNLSMPLIGNKPPATALSQSDMANGAVTLVPPQGFCIDKNTLRQRFALMARCDVLGAPSRAAGAPLALVTVSVLAQNAADPIPTPQQTADAAKLSQVEDLTTEPDTVVFRATGKPPATGLGADHWRGTVRIGDQVLGLALYGEEDGRAASAEGREILNDLIRTTREASAAGG